eukprot:1194305-Prorocentrum_minimum.AAC.6
MSAVRAEACQCCHSFRHHTECKSMSRRKPCVLSFVVGCLAPFGSAAPHDGLWLAGGGQTSGALGRAHQCLSRPSHRFLLHNVALPRVTIAVLMCCKCPHCGGPVEIMGDHGVTVRIACSPQPPGGSILAMTISGEQPHWSLPRTILTQEADGFVPKASSAHSLCSSIRDFVRGS